VKYYGGKSRLSSRIVGYIEAFRVQYGLNTAIDVCGGSGKIVMAISPKIERVYNDIGLGLCCLMEVIQDERLTAELINTLQGIPYTPPQLKSLTMLPKCDMLIKGDSYGKIICF